jgi:hypothetical protein
MDQRLSFDILAQPNATTCGPTCLHAIYGYYGDKIALADVISESKELDGGGTLASLLGMHALRRGYSAALYTYDLKIFDPTWFPAVPHELASRLQQQAAIKSENKFQIASEAFIAFLQSGGKVHMEDLTAQLLRRYLDRGIPILAGLSATWLYNERREVGENSTPDDIRGEPQGHFVVLLGYDSKGRKVLVADPQSLNSIDGQAVYSIHLNHVISAIMLGIVTYDANLLIIQPDHVRKDSLE